MWYLYIIGGVVGCFIWGFVTKAVNENKGYDGGFWLGFFLGLIGLIIVLCKPSYSSQYSNYEYASLLSTAAKEENDRKLLSNGGWKCAKCGTVNPKTTGTCGCGNTRYSNESRVKAAEEAAKVKERDDQELLNLKKLKAYKELLDAGAITQEEFDKKKAELLN